MADTSKVPSLTELEPKLLQLTLDPRHVFAVWRALECYADVCLASVQLGKKAPTSVLQAGGEVHEVLSAYMRKVLGYVEDDEPSEAHGLLEMVEAEPDDLQQQTLDALIQRAR